MSLPCRNLLLLLLALIGTTLLYLPALGGSFRFDDFNNIVNNTSFNDLGWDIQQLWQATWSSDSGMLKRPVSMASFALNVAAGGMVPSNFIATNIVIHLLCGLALALLVSRIGHILYPEKGYQNRILGLLAAFAWMIHPLNAIPVVYIVQRMTLLCALFSFLAMASYAQARLQQTLGRRGLNHFLIAILCALLAILSKENGALVPAFCVLMECILFRGKAAAPELGRKIDRIAHVTLLIGFISVGMFLIAAHDWYAHGYLRRNFTLEQRLLTEPRVLFIYLTDLVAPRLSALNLYQDDIALFKNWLNPWTTIPALLGLTGMAAAAWSLARRLPILSFAISIFLVGHSLESSVISLEIAHLHRNYLPDFGWFLLFSQLAVNIASTVPSRPLLRGAMTLWLAVISFVTYQLTSLWGNPLDSRIFAAKTSQTSPRSIIDGAQFYYFLMTTAKTQEEKERYYQLARDQYMRTLDADPPSIVGPLMILNMDSAFQHPLNRPLYEKVKQSLTRGPQSLDVLSALTSLTTGIRSGVLKTNTDALISLIIDASSNKEIPSELRGRLLNEMVVLYTYAGDYVSSEILARQAITLAPRLAELRVNLLKLCLVLKKPESEWRPLLVEARKLALTKEQETVLQDLERKLEAAHK